ncbi:MAG: alpha-L-fucosidase [Acidobacteriaceae bacterium]|nr:alpha-L-fucosidase [Acidobacteriaceae bacterium]MBV9778863.1 alpha-L-fucosidase [Acidobacteriaceae bacterium]
MNRRAFTSLLTGSAAFSVGGLRRSLARANIHYEPTWDSIQTHTVPEWYQDAKLGIFIHWGLYSVPAWAPPTGELGKIDPNTWFINNPYAEWYLNSLRITGSPTYKHHIETYGKNFDYYQFTETFNQSTRAWNPEMWASLFKKIGARYVVLTSKHHDGFRLWPSAVPNPHANGRQLSAQRDLAGDLTSAVRAAGLKMGLYYSGGLDWTFTTEPIRNSQDMKARVPQSAEYARYADAHWRELIDRYQPAILWNDINYPKAGQLRQIFAYYYNTVPEGLIDNRFGVPFSDFTTPEYAKYDKITPKKWEACRGLGFSFGYNQVEGPKEVIPPGELIALLVDIVSKNGNLLLNVGPKADGNISDIQLDRLHKLGSWLDVNGEALFDSRPWVRASATAPDGTDVRFTRKHDSLYIIFLNPVKGEALRVPSVRAADGTSAQILGTSSRCTLAQKDEDLVVTAAGRLPGSYAVTLKLTPAPKSLV